MLKSFQVEKRKCENYSKSKNENAKIKNFSSGKNKKAKVIPKTKKV